MYKKCYEQTIPNLYFFVSEKETFPPRKRFFILINPKSGPGKSLLHFKRTIEPLLMLANVSYKAVVTGMDDCCLLLGSINWLKH